MTITRTDPTVIHSHWSAEVNTLVSALTKSSCPVKTVKKWFPKCQVQNTRSNQEKAIPFIYHQNKVDESNVEKEGRAEGKISHDNDDDVDVRRRAIIAPSSNNSSQNKKNTICASIKEPQSAVRRKAFLVLSEAQLFKTKYECNWKATLECTSETKKERFERQSGYNNEISIQKRTSVRKEFRRECRERFEAERNERTSILRVHVARQRYELHRAEWKRRETLKGQMKSFKDRTSSKREKKSSTTANMIKLVKAMETGMLLLSDECDDQA